MDTRVMQTTEDYQNTSVRFRLVSPIGYCCPLGSQAICVPPPPSGGHHYHTKGHLEDPQHTGRRSTNIARDIA